MKRLVVKVCGMRDPKNLAAICEEKPDFIGFILVAESPRYAGSHITRDVALSVAPGVQKVGVFRDAELGELSECVDELSLEAVQLHGDEDVGYVRSLKTLRPSLSVVKAHTVRDGEDVERLAQWQESDLLVLDNGKGGTGESFDWSLLHEYRGKVPFLLAGGISPENITSVLTLSASVPLLWGVDINSKVESAPGIKDPTLVREVIAKVRSI